MAFNDLRKELMKLPHTGNRGFEGFVRDALAELTGQDFRLMKSGPQGGVDMIGAPGGSGLVIGMEGKHYGAKTRLPLDALKAKLHEASARFPAMDLWLLATTRGIDGGDADALAAVGATLGVETLVLDWDDSRAVPPPLAVLCAAAPAAATHHLAGRAAKDLADVRASSFYDAEVARMRDSLQSASVGLAAARDALRAWVRAHMRDPAAARTAFDSYATLEAPDAGLIARPTISEKLDNWWLTESTSAAVMLGQEGRGKTWAALSWWLSRSSADSQFPLTLIVPARDVDSSDGPGLLARALHRATGLRDRGFWRRRLARWALRDSSRPSVLLILDGLNQNWSFTRWSDLLVSLGTPEWHGKVGIILTCRPDHWAHRLKSLNDSTVPVTTIAVEPFDNSELDAVLAPHGLKRGDLPPRVEALIRIPRLSRIAIARRDDLANGEITPERLVYEDWRHRHHGARQVLDHAEFQAFVSNLGRELDQQLEASLSRAELLDRLDAGSGRPRGQFEVVLSEMIDGDWLQPGSGANQFQLNTARVPAALGLTLLDDLRQATSDNEREEIFALRLDPLQGSDISVAIIGHAATFAVTDSSVSDALRLLLLDRWTKAQNFGPGDFQSFWGLIGVRPELFLDLAEQDWFGEGGSGREDEILVKGFANAWKWSDVAAALEARLTTWFSRYWLDPREGEILGDVPDDERAAERREVTRGRAATASAEGIAATFGLTLQEVQPRRQAWGSWRAVELLSWLPRAPMLPVFTAWALTRAILGGFRQFDALAWVLRWNLEDPAETESAMLERADALLAVGGVIARDAARYLLEALASPAARTRIDSVFGAPLLIPVLGPAEWPEPPSGKRFTDRPLAAAMHLDADPLDPDLALPPDLVERLERLAAAMPDCTLIGEEQPDHAVDRGWLALARWAPHALGALVRRGAAAAASASHVDNRPNWIVRTWRRIAGSDGRSGGKIVCASLLPGALPVLDRDDLTPWRALSHRARKMGFDSGFDLHSAALADAPAFEQIELLRELSPFVVPDNGVRLLAEPSEADFDAVAHELDLTEPTAKLLAWLDWLNKVAAKKLPVGWAPIAKLVDHPDAEVRAAVFQLIWTNEDHQLAEALELSGWRFANGMNREEAAWGTLAITLAPAAAAGKIGDRVHPDGFSELAERYPNVRSYRDGFADHVFSEIEHYQTAKSRTFPRSLLTCFRGWDQLLEDHGPALMAWLHPLTHADDATIDWFFFEEFPYLRALEAVDRIAPGSKARAVTAALREAQSSNFRSGDLYAQATKLLGPAGEEARQLALAEANDDRKLFEFSYGLQKEGQTEWLLDQIHQDLANTIVGIVARGMILAGFLVPNGRADPFWADICPVPPTTGWLTDVFAAARKNYEGFRRAQYWNRVFQESSDPDAARGAWELLLASVDERFFLADHRPSEDVLATWPWRKRHQWTWGWPLVTSAVKRRKEELAKLFLGTKPPLSNQFPRRR